MLRKGLLGRLATSSLHVIGIGLPRLRAMATGISYRPFVCHFLISGNHIPTNPICNPTKEVLIAVYDSPVAHVAMPILLATSSLLSLAIGAFTAPRTFQHWSRCLASSFCFAGPLLAPPWSKVSCTSAIAHYVTRTLENVAIVAAILWLRADANIDSQLRSEIRFLLFS